jgi:hypothetical protein
VPKNKLPGAGGRLAEVLEAALPTPKPRREKQVMTVWTDEEYKRLAKAAGVRGVKLAAFVRDLALAALTTLDTK